MMNAQFGRGPVDLMHMKHHGHEVIDDRTVTLSMLLRDTGDQLFYLSDLGDAYNYSIRVIDRLPGPAVTRVAVMDARCPQHSEPRYSSSLVCPHEDKDGSRAWCERHTTPILEGRRADHDAQGRNTYDPQGRDLTTIPRQRVYADKNALLAEVQMRLDDAAARKAGKDDDGHAMISGTDKFGRHFNRVRDGWEHWEFYAGFGSPPGMLFVFGCSDHDTEEDVLRDARRFLKKHPSQVNARIPHSETCLHYAAWRGHASVVDLLLKAGALVDMLTKDGASALQLAAHASQLSCVRLLLAANASVNVQGIQHSAGQTALISAAQKGHAGIARLLLEAGADTEAINLADRGTNYDALQLASQLGHADVVAALIRAGADVNSQPSEEDGFTPLMTASFFGHRRVVKMLIDAGADLNLKSENSGQTALEYAEMRGHGEIARQLAHAMMDALSTMARTLIDRDNLDTKLADNLDDKLERIKNHLDHAWDRDEL